MRHLVRIFVATLVFTWSVSSIAEDVVYNIVSPIPYADDSGATANVKEECALDTRLPEFIEKAAGRRIDVVIGPAPEEGAEGTFLYMEITHVLGFGGGAWSGPKSVTATGELVQNGEVIGSFTSSRYSTGGAFGGFKGTCSILGRCIQAMGKDIAKWFREPTMDALLGDAG